MLYGRECLFGKFKSSAWSCPFPTSCAHTPLCPPQFTGGTQSEKQKKSWHCASSAHRELNMSILSALALVVNLEHRPTWAAMKKIKSILACTPLHTGRWNSIKKKKLKIGGAFYVLCQLNSSFFKKPCMLRKGHPALYFLVRYCWLFLSKSLLLRYFQISFSKLFLITSSLGSESILVDYWSFFWAECSMELYLPWKSELSRGGGEIHVFSWNPALLTGSPWA